MRGGDGRPPHLTFSFSSEDEEEKEEGRVLLYRDAIDHASSPLDLRFFQRQGGKKGEKGEREERRNCANRESIPSAPSL